MSALWQRRTFGVKEIVVLERSSMSAPMQVTQRIPLKQPHAPLHADVDPEADELRLQERLQHLAVQPHPLYACMHASLNADCLLTCADVC